MHCLPLLSLPDCLVHFLGLSARPCLRGDPVNIVSTTRSTYSHVLHGVKSQEKV
ncbi:hypothetical protein CPter91_4777 [Collimonas pratensis]|uniref:Uncharacterized protein n=1 Tax=Collimonas pratensis TaxID=279113 RepID=A0A127QBR6_9BURK|nr:hypothetical protein CPter91_4777 [Collimonas pratensis]